MNGFIKSDLDLKGYKVVLQPTTRRQTYHNSDSVDESKT